MAEIRITAIDTSKGPAMPISHWCCIQHREWPGGGTVPVLQLHLGKDQVEVWPAVREDIEALGRKLIAVADQLRAMEKQR